MKRLCFLFFSILFCAFSSAQCPKCFINSSSNLIVNGNFENGYSGFGSDYLIGTKGPGFYIVEKNASIYYPPYTGNDHTTGHSNFLIVDGDDKVGKRVWYQTITVTPNTDYYFSCWVTNIFIPPVTQLQFSINDVEVGLPFSPTLNYFDWSNFYVKWNSGTSTTAKLTINNKVIIFEGNDFGLDDISFTTCKPDPFYNIHIGNDSSICKEDSVFLDAPNGFDSYQWNTGATTRKICVTKAGFYSVLAERKGCKANDDYQLTLLPEPLIGFDKDYIICEEKEDSIILSIQQNYSCIWSPSMDIQHEKIFKKASHWQCKVTDKNGCTNSSEFEIKNLCYPLLFVPNAFYPNDDRLNDIFKAEGTYIVGFKMQIYNRWGQLLFISNDLKYGWDGTYNNQLCMQDIYFWTIEYYGLGGDKQKITGTTKGTVTLIR